MDTTGPATPAPGAEDLVAHGRFLRALARQLVSDPHGAEDLVQDTYVAALEHPPHHAGALTSWLGRILRRRAVTDGLRERERATREGAAARPEAGVPAPDDLAAEIELQRGLFESVERLREPYRSTLYLRYYRALLPQAIAERERVPLKTVKTRLARGLELLREDLDRRHGGREAWVALLVPFVRATPVPSVPAGPADPVEAVAPAAALPGAAALVLLAGAVAVGVAVLVLRPAPERARDSRSADAPTEAARAIEPLSAESSPPAGARTALVPDAPAVVRAARLTGELVDVAGRPVAGAEVVARVSSPGRGHGHAPRGRRAGPGAFEHAEESAAERVATHSATDGAFELTLPETGLVLLTLEEDGFAPHGQRFLVLPGQSVELGAITLAPGVFLSGTVKDEQGRPVAGASLWQERFDEGLTFGDGTPRAVQVAESDERGTFRIARQAIGAWALVARDERHPPGRLDGATRFAGERVDGLELVLSPGAEVAGIVLDPEGRPASGAVVRARGRGLDEMAGGREARADESGRFRLAGLADGTELELVAHRELQGVRFESAERSMRASLESPQPELELVLAPAPSRERPRGRVRAEAPAAEASASASAAVVVTAVRADGAPLANALVVERVSGGERRAAPDVRAVDTDGQARFEELAPGRHEFRVLHGAFGLRPPSDEDEDVGWSAVEVGAGESAELTLTAEPGARLDGRVLCDGAPLAGARVLVRAGDAPGPGEDRDRHHEHPALAATTDAEGRFAFSELRPGAFEVELLHPARPLGLTRALALAAGANTLVLALEDATLAGTVRDELGRPVAGARVRALQPEAFDDGGPARSAPSATSDAEGRFELTGLERGQRVVLESAADGRAITRSAPLEAGHAGPTPELVLVPEARLEVALGDGTSGAALVRLTFVSGVGDAGAAERVPARSTFLEPGEVRVLRGLAPGVWRVERVDRPGREASEGARAGREVELTAGAMASLRL